MVVLNQSRPLQLDIRYRLSARVLLEKTMKPTILSAGFRLVSDCWRAQARASRLLSHHSAAWAWAGLRSR
jgi:hypothetical protein